ncbi:uncharacterized protein LOC122342357 [Puntigrus tetrazona]|uniref:uncharacterized protein LOC122342357 n=1 Tax=Puntigrus tetrazona TaxID=1606681 RepID=UPI001C8B02C8|nr:uncharacterized protein LOC122342357 [Puntigrus tetrazona]
MVQTKSVNSKIYIFQIEKCPLQAHGQTTLFGGSKACSCGFHTTKPATATLSQATAAPPQSEASDTAPAPRSFLRPSSTLSMFTKSRYSGSQLSSLKPNLVERKTPALLHPLTPSASPPSPLTFSILCEDSTVATVRTPRPFPSSVRTASSSSSSPRPPSPSLLQTHVPAPFSEEPRRVQPTPAEDLASVRLPVELGKTIPVQDQRWIANTLFHSGKLRPDLKLWYEPPIPALIYHQTPTPDRFFTHRLMVWMPYHLWKVTVHCPACNKNLTGYGVHKRARKVLDIDRYYLLVTETLRCTVCSQNYLSTSQTPVSVVCQEPPEPIDIPTSRWLLSQRSWRPWTGTALWVTSIGNEVGQIVTSVLSVQEGPGLSRMVAGVMERYRQGCHSTTSAALCGLWLLPCIFEWDAGDLSLLRQAKRKQMMAEGLPAITDILVDRSISKGAEPLLPRGGHEVKRPPYASWRGCCRTWGGCKR